jgi:hypothetical protein
MPYEKTIGGDDFTYDGTLKATPSNLLDILSPADKQELLEALYKDGDQSKTKVRMAVDGWIYGTADFYTSHKVGGAEETIAAGVHYPMPVYQWFRKRLFRGFDGQPVKIRILLSVSHDKREDF